FEWKSGFARERVTREGVGRFRRVGEVSGVLEEFDLIAGQAVHRVGAIELACREGETETTLSRVTGQTFCARGNVPGLGVGRAIVGDAQVEIRADIWHEGGVGLIGVPLITDAVNACRVADE